MRRYWSAVGALFFIFVTFFLAVEWLGPAFLMQPQRLLDQGPLKFALAGSALLIADIVLPVPSSFVMIANGALFGVALGTMLSLAGYSAGAMVGFLLGRRSRALLARLVPPDEQARANRLLAQWGWLAILVTRPLPLLAETTALMAGASSMPVRTMILATLTGSLPIALLYAITGATAANLDNLLLAFGISILIAGLFLATGRIFRTHSKQHRLDESCAINPNVRREP